METKMVYILVFVFALSVVLHEGQCQMTKRRLAIPGRVQVQSIIIYIYFKTHFTNVNLQDPLLLTLQNNYLIHM